MNPSRYLILAAAGVLALGAPALAFHDAGVAHCNGCHTMHNSQNGVAMNYASDGSLGGTDVGQGHSDLLLYANKTDVCLRCHARTSSYGVWSASPTAPDADHANRGGGDFVFLLEDNLNDGHGPAIPGHQAGHNVISAMKGTVVDPANTLSPGGEYPAANLACSSCHDPHGTSSFRILYQEGQSVDGTPFVATLEAEAIPLGDGAETNSNHNAYHDNYSEWCSSCHGLFHAGSANLIHPSGELMDSEIVNTYNKYNGTSDCIANPPSGGAPCGTGNMTTAYLAAVPFEDASMTTESTSGPSDTSSYVACVTCHRAHATSAPDAGRWDFNVTGLAEDGHGGSYAIPNPYDGFQRSLCNKCHSQDEFDAAVDFTPTP